MVCVYVSQDLFAQFTYGGAAPGMMPPQQAAAIQYQQQAAMAAAMAAGGMHPFAGGMPQQMGMPGFGGPGAPQAQQQVPAHLAWQVQQQAALQWQYQQQVAQHQQQQQQQAGGMPGYPGGASPRSSAAGTPPWGAAQPRYGPVPGYGMPGMQYPGQMGAAVPGQQQLYGAGGGQVPPASSSGPASAGGSGPASGGANQWMLSAQTAGVTEQNAFADLVDLKAALPAASSSAPAAGAPQQPYGMGFGPVPPAVAQYGMGAYRAPAAGMMAQAAQPPAGYGQMGGAYPGAPGMVQQPMQPMQQQQQQYGAAGQGYAAQPMQQQWAMPAATQPAADEGNPFA